MNTWDEAYLEMPVDLRTTVRRWRKGVGKDGVKGAWYHNGMRGDRNQCAGCGEWFNSSHAFDSHRTGSFWKPGKPATRRCLSIAEMERAGFLRSESLYWITGSRTDFGNDDS